MIALSCLLALVVTFGWLRIRDGRPPDPQAAPRTSFSDLRPPVDQPTLPSLATLHPVPGTAVQAAGPFDDRLTLRQLSFDGSVVRGTAAVSDVSELLEFEAVAGFYDRSGSLVSTGRYVYHLDESSIQPDEPHGPGQLHRFSIAAPDQPPGKVLAAAVGVVVLVNE